MDKTKQKPGMGLRAGGREKQIDEGQESERKESMGGSEYDERVLLTTKPYKHILDDHLCKSPIDLLLAELKHFYPKYLTLTQYLYPIYF